MSNGSTALPAAQRWTPRLLAALTVITLLTMVPAFEYSLVYPAIRFMVPVFHTANVAWVITIMSLTGIATESVTGKLADMYGRKRILAIVSGIFVVGSLLCALAPNLPLLLLGRVLQGTFLAMTGLGYSLVRDALPPRLVPVGLGTLSTGLGISTVVGLFAGGALVDNVGFRAIFWFLLGYVVVFTPVAMFLVPDSSVRFRQRLDIPGALLLSVGVGLLLLVVSEGSSWGWGSAASLILIVVGLAMLVVFVLRSLRIEHPLVDMRLAFGPKMRTGLIAATLGAFVLGASGYLTPLMLETPRAAGIGYGFGLGALGFALFQLPSGIATIISGSPGGMLSRARSPWLTIRIGLAAMTASMLLMALWHGQAWQVIVWPMLFGLGMSWSVLAAAGLIIEAVPHEQTAISTGIMGVGRSLGAGCAVPVLLAVLAVHVREVDRASGQIVYSGQGFVVGFLVAAGVGAVALLVTLLGRRTSRAGVREGAVREREAA